MGDQYMSKKIVKPSTYLLEVKTLSDRIVKAQQPIRILDAIKWDDGLNRRFLMISVKILPK